MEKILSETLQTYFKTLENFGYLNYKKVDKILTLIAIHEFTQYDFYGYLKQDDYHEINKLLYCLFGTECLIPYPNFCINPDMNKLRLGSLSELAYILNRKEQRQNIAEDEMRAAIAALEDQKVIKPKDTEQAKDETNDCSIPYEIEPIMSCNK